MNKGIGFNRSIFLPWLDAAAELRLRSDNLAAMREGLQVIVGRDLHGVDAIRKTVDVLVNIWLKSEAVHAGLHADALQILPSLPSTQRVWLHYGLTLLYYPFFRQCAAVLGQYGRLGNTLTRQAVKDRLASELGHLGSLNRAAERVIASLVNWGLLGHNAENHQYIPKIQFLTADNLNLEVWLFSCALSAHPADELPFADLLRLPELFPFKFTVTIDQLRKNSRLTIQRQGSWDMIRLKE